MLCRTTKKYHYKPKICENIKVKLALQYKTGLVQLKGTTPKCQSDLFFSFAVGVHYSYIKPEHKTKPINCYASQPESSA